MIPVVNIKSMAGPHILVQLLSGLGILAGEDPPGKPVTMTK